MRRGEPATGCIPRRRIILAALIMILVHRIPCTACGAAVCCCCMARSGRSHIRNPTVPGLLLLYQYFVRAAALLISAGGLTNNTSNTVLEQDCAVLASPSTRALRDPRERASVASVQPRARRRNSRVSRRGFPGTRLRPRSESAWWCSGHRKRRPIGRNHVVRPIIQLWALSVCPSP
eukprot:COSAG02_NODE_3499_length_6650_cov_6.806136_3_plen_177_part_00